MALTSPQTARRTRTTDPAGGLTLRLDKVQAEFLAAEPSKAGLAIAEYLRSLVVPGLQARQLEDACVEIRVMLSGFRAADGAPNEDVALDALLEVRATAAARDSRNVANACTTSS